MECDKCREHAEEFLSNILDGDLHDEIGQHIEECPACAGLMDQFRFIRGGLIDLSFETRMAPEGLEAVKKGIVRKIKDTEISKKSVERRYVKAGYDGKLSGVTVENYEVFEEIGKGGMGTVYRAKQISMDRIVALKVLNERFALDEKFVNKFLQEARSAGKLNHLNMITVHHVGSADDKYFFAMEYVDGETVQEHLDRKDPIEPVEAVRIARQIAEALKYAHSKHIIHRDVKPDNIMIDRMHIAKLADLGIATSMRDQPQTEQGPKKAIGTPHYMSPEQARGEDLDFRSDIYSLGATLFHMVTGETPFKGGSPMETMKLRLSEPVPSVLERKEGISDRIDRLIKRMMAKNRDDRFKDYDELLKAFEVVIKTGDVRARTGASFERKRAANPMQKLVFAILGAAAAAVLVLFLYNSFVKQDGDTDSPDDDPDTDISENEPGLREPGPAGVPGPQPSDEGREPELTAEEKELDQLLEKISKNKDHPANIKLLEAFAEKFPEVRARAVEDQLMAQRNLQRRAVTNALIMRVNDEIIPLKSAEKYGECLVLLEKKYKAEFEKIKNPKAYAGLCKGVNDLAFKKFAAIKGRADKFSKTRDYDDAIKQIEEARKFKVPAIDKQVKKYVAGIKALHNKEIAANKKEQAAKAGMIRKKFLDEIAAYETGMRFQEGADKCAKLLRNPDYNAAADLIKQKKSDFENLLRLDDLAVIAIRKMVGTKYRFKKKDNAFFQKAEIRGIEDGNISLVISEFEGSISMTLKMEQLAFEEIIRLARRAVMGSGKHEDHIALFLGYLALNNAEEADRQLASAFRTGLKNGGYYKDIMAARAAAGTELKAEELLAEIKDMMAAKRFTGMENKLKKLKDIYGDTKAVKANAALMSEAEGELAYYAQAGKLAQYFKGRVTADPGRNFQLKYDFKNAPQLEDWVPVLGNWDSSGQGLAGVLKGDARGKTWHFRSHLLHQLKFSGELYFGATVEFDNLHTTWHSSGLVMGPYRLELPWFEKPELNKDRKAGVTKLLTEGSKSTFSKTMPVQIQAKKKYNIALEVVQDRGGAFLTVIINDFRSPRIKLKDGLPVNAELGFYNTNPSKTRFSNVVVRGKLNDEMLAYLQTRAQQQRDLIARLNTGKPVSIFNGRDLNFWRTGAGIFSVENKMIRAHCRGMLIFDVPLEEYEISATVLKYPTKTNQNYGKMHLLAGLNAEAGTALRVGFGEAAQPQPFYGWEIGDGMDTRKRLQCRALDEKQKTKVKERVRPAVLTIRYTQKTITILYDDKEVYSAPNPKPVGLSRCGLFQEWNELWFKDITLKKL